MTVATTHRPDRLVVVVGTGTEVGKTWVAAAVLGELRRAGTTVAARKPVQSFAPGDATTDAAELAAATGEDPHQVCPPHRWYEVPMAPPMAAAALSRPSFTIADLTGELRWPAGVGLGLVETAGGVRSPMAADGDGVSLVVALAADVIVVVADAGLGTINGVRLTLEALRSGLGGLGAPATAAPMIVVLNRFDQADPLHRRNLAWLRDEDGDAVVTSPGALATHLRPRTR